LAGRAQLRGRGKSNGFLGSYFWGSELICFKGIEEALVKGMNDQGAFPLRNLHASQCELIVIHPDKGKKTLRGNSKLRGIRGGQRRGGVIF